MWTGALLGTADRTDGGRGEGRGHDDSTARPGPCPLGRRADPALGRPARPPVFAARSLWLSWLYEDGTTLPVVMPVDDVPRAPELPTLRGLVHLQRP
jgi:hypothetical protein